MRSHGKKILKMAMSRRSHGVFMANFRRSFGELGVSTELHGVPTAFKLAIDCALTALPLRASSCRGARTVLMVFCLHSMLEPQRLLRIEVLLRLRLQNIRIGSSSPVNISKTKVMYNSSRHKQHTIYTSDADLCYKIQLLPLIQMKTFLW